MSCFKKSSCSARVLGMWFKVEKLWGYEDCSTIPYRLVHKTHHKQRYLHTFWDYKVKCCPQYSTSDIEYNVDSYGSAPVIVRRAGKEHDQSRSLKILLSPFLGWAVMKPDKSAQRVSRLMWGNLLSCFWGATNFHIPLWELRPHQHMHSEKSHNSLIGAIRPEIQNFRICVFLAIAIARVS